MTISRIAASSRPAPRIRRTENVKPVVNPSAAPEQALPAEEPDRPTRTPANAEPAPSVVQQSAPAQAAPADTAALLADLLSARSGTGMLEAMVSAAAAANLVSSVHFNDSPSIKETPEAPLSTQTMARGRFLSDSIHNALLHPHGIQFGGEAGLNGSAASAYTPNKVNGKPLTGFGVAVFADIPLKNKSLSLHPKIEYAFEGYHPDFGGEAINIHVAYLRAPVDLIYHSQLVHQRLLFGLGPYAATAMGGTYTLKDINTNLAFGNNYSAGDNLRHSDYGANAMADLLMDKNFIIGAQVDWGFRNIAPEGSGGNVHTRSVGITLQYLFRDR